MKNLENLAEYQQFKNLMLDVKKRTGELPIFHVSEPINGHVQNEFFELLFALAEDEMYPEEKIFAQAIEKLESFPSSEREIVEPILKYLRELIKCFSR